MSFSLKSNRLNIIEIYNSREINFRTALSLNNLSFWIKEPHWMLSKINSNLNYCRFVREGRSVYGATIQRGECTGIERSIRYSLPIEIIVYKSPACVYALSSFFLSGAHHIVCRRCTHTMHVKSCAAVKVLSARPLAHNRDIISRTECQRR